jgi:acyl transferase domain-containing protein/3-hydroxymyristoyl/3-hydroxydecanoyl-(acyl carrier protein) dehydratase
MHPNETIAIVGIGGLFPGAETLEQFWANVREGIDSTSDVPPGRWLVEPERAFDPRVAEADRVYSIRGGFIERPVLDRQRLDLDPALLDRLDPVFHLAIQVAQQAWSDAQTDGVDRSRVGVVFGNIVLPTETASELTREVLGAVFEEQLGLDAREQGRTEPLNAFPAGMPAALVARALGLRGPAYTIDAACGSSLYSLKLAIDELRAGRADAMLCGGVSRPDPLYTQMGFSQLRALSARGKAAPLDQRADGLVVGEGAGMFVLKRLDDALAHGDQIYAVVAGIGLSNDIHGDLLAPSSEGQLRAMRMAYEQAGWSSGDVDLIECHAAGTAIGDAVEAQSLKALWGEAGWKQGQCTIGSVKSNVGHALTAAGAAGLLKVLLALKHETLPPTANFERSAPALGLDESPFRVLTRADDWPRRAADQPRRAAISGFGFGGINCHVLIEEWDKSGKRETPAWNNQVHADRNRSAISTPITPLNALAPFGEGEPPGEPRHHPQFWEGEPPGEPRHHPARTEPRPPGITQGHLAIVGLSVQFGPFEGKERLENYLLGDGYRPTANNPRNAWGIPESAFCERLRQDDGAFAGYFIDSLEFGVEQFRIPPRELGEMQPQQSLMLRVAAEAIGDARWDVQSALRTGVLIGIGLDLNTTNYYLRWSMAARAGGWNEELGLALSPDELAGWTDELTRSAGPALTANRTMGSLGGLIASRIAREFKIGGPCFTVSCDETSGMQALAIAAGWLRAGELDAVIVGAVDFAGDARAVLARQQLRASAARVSVACDGAVALVVKRLEDAQRDGDRVYAVIGEIATGSGTSSSSASIGDRSAHDIESIETHLGNAGAATGLGTVAMAALCLDRRILPGSDPASGPSYWIRNRAEGPRRARVSETSLGDNHASLILEEFEGKRAMARQDALHPRMRIGLFAIESNEESGLAERVDELRDLARTSSARDIDMLAREWWHRYPNDPGRRFGKAVVADSVEALAQALDDLSAEKREQHAPAAVPARLAFVYPGLGNQFAGMGRGLSALWPGVLDFQDSQNELLKEQLDPRVWWNGELPRSFADHRSPILGSVSVGALVTDVLRNLGVCPDAAIGYSLGESAALVALSAWTDRDELLRRLRSSPLFHSELAGSCDAARRLWRIPSEQPVDWVAGIVARSAETVRAAIGVQNHVYVLIRNTSDETVIGGERAAVAAVVKLLRCPFLELSTVSTVHCELARTVEAEYHALHDLATTAPEGIEFYSGAWARPYPVDRRSAADAITAQALGTIDFPALVERAYHDGIRFFLEVGPGSSCTRLIGQILRGRPHVVISACRPDRDPLAAIVDVLAGLITHRLPVDLASLYGHSTGRHVELQGSAQRTESERRHKVRVDVRGGAFKVPPLPVRRAISQVALDLNIDEKTEETLYSPASLFSEEMTAMAPHIFAGEPTGPSWEDAGMIRSSLVRSVHDAERATGEAHQAFLRVAQGAADLIGKQLYYQHKLINDFKNGSGATATSARARMFVPPVDDEPRSSVKPVLFDRAQCLEFAIGSIAAVLGPEFADIDRFPTRVRLPDEPLMLVDRILSVEGQPRSLESGRVVTEHVIEPGSWYLDAGRIAPCIAIEAGQADLFLCGYLGVDFETKGLAVYRLLDATVTFHRGLPAAGDLIRYDIRISNFFRQGRTILFRFQFDATVAGEPLLTMRDGCAGFFTADELAAGKGIVPRSFDLPMKPRAATLDDTLLIPVSPARLDEIKVDALRRGDFATAFGSPFDRIDLRDPLALPGGRMSLVHRVSTLDPTGGQWGLGLIRAEADVHPGDWFMVCHFVDDRVMPGTLMYECCLHTLRIFMMRLGWIGSRGRVAYEPVVGVANRLRCRGQIIESTRVVTYEITIQERGFRPEPYAIADALILADGKPIVAVTDMALQLSGTNKQALEALWAGSEPIDHSGSRRGEKANAAAPIPGATGAPAAIFDHDRILAFAVGNPSAAFGDRYLPFDEGRFIARLPGPPYQFLDRITQISAQPWVMVPGGSAEAQFDVIPDAWYFSADCQDRMPFAVLLEVALQACGWMAAYMGAALTSDGDLKFRNLGGTGRQHLPVMRDTGTLTTRFRATKISRLAGMILLHYEFAVESRHGLVYDGSAEFGFFDPRALEQQVGIRELVPCSLSAGELAVAESLVFPSAAPFPDSRWRMIDRIDALVMQGGPHGFGVVQGTANVDPAAWFFQAHFLDDPVWPGSLGLESLLQLLKIFAAKRWGVGRSTVFESPVIGQSHGWTYRGQIIPTNRIVGVQAEIKVCDDQARLLVADGHLQVDGKVIYKMNDFSLRLVSG